MNNLFERIGYAITSMAAVIFVLVLTLLGLLTFTHTLFNEVLPSTITGWERSMASWLLALGWEFTLLITTCNTQFLNRRIPILVAIASGIIVLFFIQAFDVDQRFIELSKKWFIGILVATINYIYTELFYSKWKDLQYSRDLSLKVIGLESEIKTRTEELSDANNQLSKSKADVERLIDYVAELENFKRKEVEKLTCPYCKNAYENIYKLGSHKGICQHNPKKGLRRSIFEVEG
jgi:hypothetical protein